MSEVSLRHAAEHLPWLLIFAPMITAPIAVLCERAIRSRRAHKRARRMRRLLGEPREQLSLALSDTLLEVTALGTLRAKPNQDACPVAMSWFPSASRAGAVHASSDRDWYLEMTDASVALEGPFEILVGAEETARGTPLARALEWADLQSGAEGADDAEGEARVVRDGDRVRVRGTLMVEPTDGHGKETYRAREVRARLTPSAGVLRLAAEAAPAVALRPAIVRVARMTITMSVAFALIPAVAVMLLQWHSMHAEIASRNACLRTLETARDEHRPWDAADAAADCGTRETEAHIAWHNAELVNAARHYRRRRADWAELDNHASNAASQIVAGHYDEAARIANRMAMTGPNAEALRCLAAGLLLMHEPSPWAHEELSEGAAREQHALDRTTDDTPIVCTPLLADLTGDTSALHEQVRASIDGAAPGYFNTYLAALLAAERGEGLAHPLIQLITDARHPPLAVQKPRDWALTHPIALSSTLLRSQRPETAAELRTAAAFAAQQALFDAYMGESELAVTALHHVKQLADTQGDTLARDASGDVLIIGAAAAILARDLGMAESLLGKIRDGDDRVTALRTRLALRGAPQPQSHFTFLAEQERWLKGSALWRAAERGEASLVASALSKGSISSVHGFFPYIALHLRDDGSLRDWLADDFFPLCETCGLGALAEHIASRRVAAMTLDDPMASRLAEPARRLHGAMLRRDIALPLYLLERITDANR